MRLVLVGLSRWSAGRWLAAVVVAAVLVGAASAQAAMSVSFAPHVEYQTASRPGSVAVGDFNGDGHPDLVTANYTEQGTVSVLLGNGDGTFKAKTDYVLGPGTSSVAVGDFNRDGRPDLAVTHRNYSDTIGPGQSVSVLLGKGDGTFAPKVDYATGTDPESVAVGDLNGDGKPDVVTANFVDNSVSVLLGRGDGSFASKSDYPTGGGPQGVAVGDLNKDGSPDVVTANGDGNVSVLRGNPNGTLAPRSDYLASLGQGNIRHARAFSVVVGDFNGDGNPDLATANFSVDTSSYNSVSVLLGHGDATFAPMTAYQNDRGPISLAVGDFNGDGQPDLAGADPGDSTASVLVGNADGTFAPITKYAAPGAGSVAVGDFNGDGLPDLATADSCCNTVSVLLNTTQVAVPPGGTPPPSPGGVVQGAAPSSPPATGTPPDKAAPGVTNYGLTNNPFAVGGGQTPTFASSAAKKPKHKQGTAFKYTLSEAASVQIAITQSSSGRRKGKQCVAPSRKLRKKAKCTRTFTKGTLTRTSHAGANTVAFSGRIGSKALKPGRYQATLTAADAAKNTSKAQTASFTIVRR